MGGVTCCPPLCPRNQVHSTGQLSVLLPQILSLGGMGVGRSQREKENGDYVRRWAGRMSRQRKPQRSYDRRGNLRGRPQTLGTMKEDRGMKRNWDKWPWKRRQRVSSTSCRVRSRASPPRKKDFKGILTKEENYTTCEAKIDRTKRKIDKFLRSRTRCKCPLLPPYLTQGWQLLPEQ